MPRLPCVALLLVALLLADGAVEAQPRTDLYGDPLPDGALARLGTAKRRVSGQCWLSPDGKTIASLSSTGVVQYWDAIEPKLLRADRRFERPLEPRKQIGETALSPNVRQVHSEMASVSSPDGSILAVYQDSKLELYDLFTLERLPVKLPPRFPKLIKLQVSADQSTLVLHMANMTSVWDAKAGKPKLLLFPPTGVHEVSPNGRYVTLQDQAGEGGRDFEVRVWDLNENKVVYAIRNGPVTRFMSDANRLLAQNISDAEPSIVDLTTGKTVGTLKIPDAKFHLESANPSDRGTHLFFQSNADRGFAVYDMKAGAWHTLKFDQGYPGNISFAADGRSILVSDPILDRIDIRTGKSMYPEIASKGHTIAISEIFVSADGRRLTSLGFDQRAITWDVSSSKLQHEISMPIDILGVVFFSQQISSRCQPTPDGKELIEVMADMHVREWSLADGKLKKKYALSGDGISFQGMRPLDVRVLPRENTLLISSHVTQGDNPPSDITRRGLSYWERGTGRFKRWGPVRESEGEVLGGHLSSDGRWSIGGGFHDLLTGAVVPGLERTNLLSRDGRWAMEMSVQERKERDAFYCNIQERATGRTPKTLKLNKDWGHCCISPDGSWLAAYNAPELAIWDLVEGRVVQRYTGPVDEIDFDLYAPVVFFPDGRTIATGHRDGTILLWPAPTRPKEKPLTDAEAAALWKDLGDEEPSVGWKAVRRFTGDPDKLAALVRTKLPLPKAKDAAEYKTLVEQLSAETFQLREAAQRTLIAIGYPAQAHLRERLKIATDLEERRRIQKILSSLTYSGLERGDDLRAVRAFAALEFAPTPGGMRLLEEWSQRASKPWLAHEAAMALLRCK